MHRVVYTSGSTGETVQLDGDTAFVATGGGLRSRKWTRLLGSRSLRGAALNAREVKVDCIAYDAAADDLRRIADADVASKTPGTITVDGEWKCRCFVVESETSEVYYEAVKTKLTVAMVDGYWYRDKSKHFVTGLDDGGIDHPYDYPHDLSYVAGKGQLIVETRLGAKPKITFYGPVTNPYITFAGNRYEVDVQVLSGWKVVIDALDSTPTVRKVDSYGNWTSVFADAVRDGGLGGGSYAFQPIPYGTHEVTWSGAFSFDIEWREIDTEPPWNS